MLTYQNHIGRRGKRAAAWAVLVTDLPYLPRHAVLPRQAANVRPPLLLNTSWRVSAKSPLCLKEQSILRCELNDTERGPRRMVVEDRLVFGHVELNAIWMPATSCLEVIWYYAAQLHHFYLEAPWVCSHHSANVCFCASFTVHFFPLIASFQKWGRKGERGG